MSRLEIVGGVYRERCLWPSPELDLVFGSGGRAAAALASSGVSRTLHTYSGPDLAGSLSTIFGAYDFRVEEHERPDDIVFSYVHTLAIPDIEPGILKIRECAPINISAERAIRFGMLEGQGIVDAGMCVYDPQSAYAPARFSTNGSSASRLAIVANASEVRRLTNEADAVKGAAALLAEEEAEVVVVKSGLDGAIVLDNRGSHRVPAYRVSSAWTIGSGDVFVALFSLHWMINGRDPREAADAASRGAAHYIETLSLPIEPSDRVSQAVTRYGGKVYLAGPFFSIGQRSLIDEIRRCFSEFGIATFSPVHDVGRGDAHDVAPRDIEAIRECDAMFAVLDGVDSGTLFEIGYARALDKPVFGLAQSVPDEDLKMVLGSGCTVSDDLVSLVFAVAQGR